MIVRQHSRSNILVAGLLMVLLFLPAEYLYAGICPMEKQAAKDTPSESCCPITGDTENKTGSDGTTDIDSNAENSHCNMESPAHPSCDDCGCFLLPFSDKNNPAENGITVTHSFSDLSINSDALLFTIPIIVFREHPVSDPGPSLIPIYLINQVFLN